jgi:hypothetical protein
LAYVCWLYKCGLAIIRVATVGFEEGAYVVTLVSGGVYCQCAVANGRRNQNSPSWAQSLLVDSASIRVPATQGKMCRKREVRRTDASALGKHIQVRICINARANLKVASRPRLCRATIRRQLTSSHGPVSIIPAEMQS